MEMPLGKYRGLDLSVVKKDPSYCAWLLRQTWFRERYPAHYEAVAGKSEPRISFCFMQIRCAPVGCSHCAVCWSDLPETRPDDVVVAAVEDRDGRSELIAIVGPCCLTKPSLRELARLRAEAETVERKTLP